MTPDRKKEAIKALLETGHLRLFREIFVYYPITGIIRHLKSSHHRLTKTIENPEMLRFEEIFKIADFFEVEPELMIKLVANQIKLNDKAASSARKGNSRKKES